MKALVYHGPGSKAWEEVPQPQILDDTDAIVRVDCTTICGSDLHILKGDVPEVTEGRILGHEAVGTVESVGSAVTTVAPGDRVLVSCISACGRCRFCREEPLRPVPRRRRLDPRPPHRRHAGRVRPGPLRRHLDLPGARKVPSDEEILMLADILPTAYEVGVLNGHVQPGDTVVVVGAGPIGLSAILGAQLYSPSRIIAIDLADARLEAAKLLRRRPARSTTGGKTPSPIVRNLTDGLGADVAIEAVGVPASFELCTELVRPGGHVANIGVHGKPATLHLEIPVDPGRHHHHRAGRHLFDSDAAAPGRLPSDRCRALRHPSLRAA